MVKSRFEHWSQKSQTVKIPIYLLEKDGKSPISIHSHGFPVGLKDQFWMSLPFLDPSCHDGQLIPRDQGCLRRAIAGAPQLSSPELLCQQNFFLSNLTARLNLYKFHILLSTNIPDILRQISVL